jgi:hypothetical protein
MKELLPTVLYVVLLLAGIYYGLWQEEYAKGAFYILVAELPLGSKE